MVEPVNMFDSKKREKARLCFKDYYIFRVEKITHYRKICSRTQFTVKHVPDMVFSSFVSIKRRIKTVVGSVGDIVPSPSQRCQNETNFASIQCPK